MTVENMREAIAGHLMRWPRPDNPSPDPEVLVDYVDVPLPILN